VVVGKDALSGGKLVERDKFDAVEDGPADTGEIDAEIGDTG